MDSIEKLVEYYNKSNEQNVFHDVVEHILMNLHKIKKVTIYDLADMCYSSPSTISRLVKKLEFKDYADFRSKISYQLENYRYMNRNMRAINLQEEQDSVDLYFNFLQNNISALRDMVKYEDIKKISDYFFKAEKIFFYSYPAVNAESIQKSLIVSGKKAYLYQTILLQKESLEQIEKKTIIFAIIPDLLEMAPTRNILKKAKERGAVIITICSGKRNDYAKCSDVQISFEGTKTSMDLYLFMILVNIIQYDYSNRYLDPIMDEMYDEQNSGMIEKAGLWLTCLFCLQQVSGFGNFLQEIDFSFQFR